MRAHVWSPNQILPISKNGEEVVPGSHRAKYSDPPKCPRPFRNMIAANAHEAIEVPGAPRRTAAPTAARTSTNATRPANQIRNAKVGIGNHGTRDRIERTKGL